MRLVSTSLLVLCAAGVACGPPPHPERATDADLREITETQAGEIIAEVGRQSSVVISSGWRVNIGTTEPFEVDFRLGETAFGVEWVTPQDRADFGNHLPEPDPNGQLKIVPGRGADGAVQILVLEATTYRYDPDADRVQQGSFGMREAEGNIQRDVRDYFQYVRDQGGI